MHVQAYWGLLARTSARLCFGVACLYEYDRIGEDKAEECQGKGSSKGEQIVGDHGALGGHRVEHDQVRREDSVLLVVGQQGLRIIIDTRLIRQLDNGGWTGQGQGGRSTFGQLRMGRAVSSCRNNFVDLLFEHLTSGRGHLGCMTTDQTETDHQGAVHEYADDGYEVRVVKVRHEQAQRGDTHDDRIEYGQQDGRRKVRGQLFDQMGRVDQGPDVPREKDVTNNISNRFKDKPVTAFCITLVGRTA